jgi:hypothetical protein
MKRGYLYTLFSFVLVVAASQARAADQPDATQQTRFFQSGPADCSEMEIFDYGMWMCMPIAMEGMPMRMAMLHGQVTGGEDIDQGPRGRSSLFSTSMVMADLGTTLGSSHYVNIDFMGTAEKWTFPARGYPELLQIGEQNSQGVAYIDAQHPHSSPIMGLTLSDTIRFTQASDNSIKVFFAPRGESTDGPVAFMHRPTGIYNPDAPLGHHIGQDVGHISSTLIGASLKLGSTRLEASTFNGTEPEPDVVDLPIGTPNSVAVRAIEEFSSSFQGMISAAYVRQPEPDEANIPFVARYSASLYHEIRLPQEWTFYNAFIYGRITKYDYAPDLNSFDEEFLFAGSAPRVFGRIELLQRTPAELEVPTSADPNHGIWVAAFTLGYSHKIASIDGVELDLGGSVTKDLVPETYIGSYGGNPWSGKAFLRLGGMQMWSL